jgi:hypothetical protein
VNSKTLLGFVAGVAVALGLSYVISHRGSQPKPATETAAVAPAPAAVEAPEAPEAQIAKPTAPPSEPTPVTPPSRLTPSSIVRPRAAGPSPVAHATRETASAPPQAPAPAPVASAPPAPTPAPVAAPVVITTPEPAPAPRPAPSPSNEARVFRPEQAAPARPPAREPSTVTLKEGTVLAIRLGEGLSSDRNRSGDEFTGTLDQALVVDNLVVAERGARVEGRVVESQLAGRVKGLAHMSIELTRLHTADGQKVAIRTTAHAQDGPESKKEDAAKVGAGAAIGAIIGAIAGGGKGAAIGAGVGGAAGGGTVAATRGKPVVLPVESHLTFRLEQPVTITEQLRN